MLIGASEALAGTASPYGIAAIAGGGAILGALISGLSTLAAGRRAARSQRLLLEGQLEHATVERVATERRKCYADFLDVEERLHRLEVEVCGALNDAYDLSGGALGRREWGESEEAGRVLAPYEGRLAEIEEEWRAADVHVRLLASWRVNRLTSALMVLHDCDIQAIWEGFDIHGERTRSGGELPFAPNEVLAAMQRDLGVADGVAVDPGPGVMP